jgi:NADPH:quinone reductase-like Zn-dependent oxidoreductase
VADATAGSEALHLITNSSAKIVQRLGNTPEALIASLNMRAVVITKHGDFSVLRVQERPDPPPPGPGQVRVAVHAAGVNFADHLARVGLYPDAPKPPVVVGYEVAGIIEAVGDGVDAARVGERVFAGTRFGGYAEIVNVRAADAVPLPKSLTSEQGAAIPVNYATA